MSMLPQPTQLLGELKRLANLRLGATMAMPPGLYNSEEIYRLELERIFARDWVCP